MNSPKQSGGFALLEVLLAFLVLAFGLLGVGQLIMVGHQSNGSSYIKQQAVQSAYDIVERIRANKATAVTGSYNVSNLTSGSAAAVVPSAPSTNCSTTTCTATQLATYDVWSWLAQDLAQVPNGSGSVATAAVAGGSTLITVIVQWDDSQAQSTLGAANKTVTGRPNLAQFTVQTLL